MANEMYFLKAENEGININLQELINKTKNPIKFKTEGTKTVKDVDDELTNALNTKQYVARENEKNKKKFKLLQKYGYVLESIGDLLGMIPKNFDNLSLTDLTEKLEDLMKTRNSNFDQNNYMFSQNLFSKKLDDIIAIETAYQSGELSSNEALRKIKSIKKELNDNHKTVPDTLKPAEQELAYLISKYEEGFVEEDIKDASSMDRPPRIVPHELNSRVKLEFEQLNAKTRELSEKVTNLHTNLSNFQPVVNLDQLYAQIKSTDEMIDAEDFDADEASYKVEELKQLTNNLTNEQRQKNIQNNNFETEIKTLSENVKETSNNHFIETSKNTFEDSKSRLEKIVQRADLIKKLTEGNNSMPEDIAEQIANVLTAQANADERTCDDISNDERVRNYNTISSYFNRTFASVEELREFIAELTRERQPKFEGDKPEDEEDDAK